MEPVTVKAGGKGLSCRFCHEGFDPDGEPPVTVQFRFRNGHNGLLGKLKKHQERGDGQYHQYKLHKHCAGSIERLITL